MINKSLFKSILPGLLPLFVFIIADEIWGTEIGLYVALGFGILELIYTYIKTRKIEKFILLDTLLLVGFGGVSILLDNDIFFKLKPAIIEMILAVLLGISAFSPSNLVLKMSARYLKNIQVNEQQMQMMRKSLRGVFFVVVIHIILIVISAYFMSKEAWAFISGGLFYIIFAAYFGFEFLKARRIKKNAQQEEWLPEIDQEGKVIATYPRSAFHDGSKKLHPVIHLHVFNEKGELFLQKRPLDKLVQPGKWDTAVGGHISAGEKIELALQRETEEEIGLTNVTPTHFQTYVWESSIEKELIFMFYTKTDQTPAINKDELSDGRFWKLSEIGKNIGKGIFTPNFEKEFELVKQIKL